MFVYHTINYIGLVSELNTYNFTSGNYLDSVENRFKDHNIRKG